VAEWLKASDC